MSTIPQVRSYAEAAELYARRKPGTRGYKLGPNLQLVRLDYGYVTASGDHAYVVRLYGHDLIRYYPDGTFSVDDGGWNTPTTRRLLNRYCPEGWDFEFRDRKLVGWIDGGKDMYPSPSDRLLAYPFGRKVQQ